MEFYARPQDQRGFIVPQPAYHPPSVYTRLPSIKFREHGIAGVNLANALNDKFDSLEESQAPVHLSLTATSKISVRLIVRVIFSCQIIESIC